ncbi:hypothetical protein KAF25_004027 [Fusarium avenaceum]|uniref:DUF7708 domain-containing protein n=1 Tax=Fusarium avenaceum TaxID=40199 RepID=A0A9P7H8H2_9HYPO|nr:hypothetical protein KAF25_004027 [Fusarium avenaceum]
MTGAMQEEQRNLFLSSRDRHPSSEAAVFIENHVALSGQQRPVFSERGGGFVSLNEANKQQQESTTLWKEVDEEKERLFELMQQVQKKLSKEHSSEDMIDLRKCSWREVMGQVQKTAQRWKLRPNKQGRTMILIDKLGRHSSALESWLGLLPSGDYGSSICGVFKLAIGAAGQYGKVEETIFEALSEIPIIMESAGRYVDMYWKMRDQYLEQRTFELFRAILQLLRYVMQFFADGKTRKVFEGMMKQEGYKAEINESLEEIRKRAQAVNNEAQQCQARMVFKISDKLDENKEQAHVIFQMLNELLLTHPRLRSDSQENHRIFVSESHLKVTGYDWVNADHLALSDLGDSPKEQSPLRRTSSPFMQHNSNMNNVTEAKSRRKQLLECLRYDKEALAQDISSFIRLGYQLSNHEKSRAAAMITSDQFKSFMQETRHSTCLLVNGRQDLATSNSLSPLSLVVAELANKSQEQGSDLGPVFVISYFCAARQSLPSNNASASQNTAAGMVASLVGQLIEQLGDRNIIVDLSFMTSKTWRKVEELDAKMLCRVFRKLIGQTPPGSAILCMIDEISLYETQTLDYQTSFVMEKLVQLVHREQVNAQQVFKLSVTCQDRALGISRLFPGCTLDLPEEIEMDDAADWAISAM